MKVVVTGAFGKAGRFVVNELKKAGWEVIAADLNAAPRSSPSGDLGGIRVDVRNFGQAVELLEGADAVVHLANVSLPGMQTNATTFSDNITMNYNIFAAAKVCRVGRVVWLSSSSVIGDLYDPNGLVPFPADESLPNSPRGAYALSKSLTETMASHMADDELTIIGLRAAVVEDPASYSDYPNQQTDPLLRMWHMWDYVDARDLARACKLAIEAPITGAHVMFIAAADTVMNRPTAELYQLAFGDRDARTPPKGFNSFISTERARQLIGYEPQHSWRDTRGTAQ